MKKNLFSNTRSEILIITHYYVKGAIQELDEYLISHNNKTIHLSHPLTEYNKNLITNVYSNGKIQKRIKLISKILPLNTIQIGLINFFLIYKNRKKIKIILAANCINTFCAILIKKIFNLKINIVYYSIDYVKNRFSNSFYNFIYRKIEKYSSINADMIWNLTDRMSKARKNYLFVNKKYLTPQITVPIGVHKRENYNIKKINSNPTKVVFMGTISKKQGIDLILDVSKKLDSNLFYFEIIGNGPYKKELEKRKISENLKNVNFSDAILNRKKLIKKLNNFHVGISTYEDNTESFTYYADPTKPKDYLLSGLQVIITKLPKISKIISRQNLGFCIDYNSNSLKKTLLKINKRMNYEYYSKKNKNYVLRHFEWETIFASSLKSTIDEFNKKN